MSTLREVMEHLAANEITLEQVAEHLRQHPPEVHQPASSLLEAYERAEDMPSDNDTFWIDCAYDQRVIDDERYDHLFDVIAANRAT